MTILEALIQLRDDLKLWCINNFNHKLNKNLGTDESGKFLSVDENGDISTASIDPYIEEAKSYTDTAVSAKSDDFYITPTEINSDLGTNVYALDKTIDEINAALEEDDHVWFVYTDADAEWKIPMVRQLATLAIADGILYFYSMINPQYVVAVTIRNYNGTAGAVIETGEIIPGGGTEDQLLMRNAAGGVEWGDIDTEAFEIVNVTGDIDSGYTADKTVAELLDAFESGKQLVCIVNNTIVAQHTSNDSDSNCVIFAATMAYTILGAFVAAIEIRDTGVTMNMVSLPDAEKVGSLNDLDTEDKSSIVNAINEVHADVDDIWAGYRIGPFINNNGDYALLEESISGDNNEIYTAKYTCIQTLDEIRLGYSEHQRIPYFRINLNDGTEWENTFIPLVSQDNQPTSDGYHFQIIKDDKQITVWVYATDGDEYVPATAEITVKPFADAEQTIRWELIGSWTYNGSLEADFTSYNELMFVCDYYNDGFEGWGGGTMVIPTAALRTDVDIMYFGSRSFDTSGFTIKMTTTTVESYGVYVSGSTSSQYAIFCYGR